MSVETNVSTGIENARFHVGAGADKIARAITKAGSYGYILVPPGIYLVEETLRPLDGQVLDLTQATLVYDDDTALENLIDVSEVEGGRIVGGVLDGNCAQQSLWNEHRHGISFHDATNWTVENVTFKHMIADAVYISHKLGATPPYTGSSDIKVIHNRVLSDHDNRNGVSVVCGERIIIAGNTFHHIGRTGASPGAVDLEPNDSNDFIHDVKIVHNLIDYDPTAVAQVNGGIGAGNYLTDADFSSILIADNTIRGTCFWGIRIRMRAGKTEQAITIARNHILNINPTTGNNYGIRLDDCDADVIGNVIDGVNGQGISQARSTTRVIDNQIRNIHNNDIPGNAIGFGLADPNDITVFRGNLIDTVAIGIDVRGSSNSYEHNTIRNATYGVYIEGGTLNQFVNTRFVNVTNPWTNMGAQFVRIDPSVSADNGNASKTLTALVSEPTQLWATTVTTDRAVTLSTVNAFKGATFRIMRPAIGGGNLLVGTGPLKSLPASTWCDVTYSGSAWILSAYGSL